MGKNNYVLVHYPVLRRKDLSDRSKLLYGLVQGFWTGMCKATDSYIALTIGCSERNVQRAIKQLKDKGLIKSVFRYSDKGKIIGRTLTLKIKYD